MNSNTEANKALVREVMTAVFVRRDFAAVSHLFASDYRQHNPALPNGPEAIPAAVAGLGQNFKYEAGMIVADGDLVMVHGRYTGWASKPVIAVDIFRIANGKLTEHWDVIQEEVPADMTKNGNAMFTPPSET